MLRPPNHTLQFLFEGFRTKRQDCGRSRKDQHLSDNLLLLGSSRWFALFTYHRWRGKVYGRNPLRPRWHLYPQVPSVGQGPESKVFIETRLTYILLGAIFDMGSRYRRTHSAFSDTNNNNIQQLQDRVPNGQRRRQRQDRRNLVGNALQYAFLPSTRLSRGLSRKQNGSFCIITIIGSLVVLGRGQAGADRSIDSRRHGTP